MSTNKIRVFVSFDVEHDGDLYQRLLSESRLPNSLFAISGSSVRPTASSGLAEGEQHRIRAADQMIVICGEHTGTSLGVASELHVAQEEHTPYFMLWGRREVTCTKPAGSKSGESMYSWTEEFLLDRLDFTRRKVEREIASRKQLEAIAKR